MKYKLIIDRDAQEEIVATVNAPSSLTEEIENLILRYSGSEYIIGFRDDEMRKLAFSEIECVITEDRKVIAIDAQCNKYIIKDRLYELEESLPSYFIRINKSALANEHRILRFDATFSGGVDAVFACGYKEYVSRRCFAQIKRRYGV
ncbi:MAG: LytTR family transcriptional regulator [Clostridia bacterium]|nr:LytTR family transcriptional regulator [Clostridia bacterium]MBQ7873527.1 LytTR family transcriptional regulator [Clostridia bacterium]